MPNIELEGAGWGAYGASKAALRHLTAIWAEEAKADGVSFLSIDPGDMDTPLHALAVPDADPRLLPVLLVVPLQLLAYHAAVILGLDVDKPRNLAKSVTVE